jgi:hypothetical protein
MCGGGGKPPQTTADPPPPTPPPELLLDAEGRKSKDRAAGKKRVRAGRGALVTPGLNIGATIGGAIGTALGELSIAGRK